MITWQTNKRERLEKKATERSQKQLQGITFMPKVNSNAMVVPKDVKKNNLEYQMKALDQHLQRMHKA
jgi:translation initiation factor 6 (eIF-6)